MPTATATRSRTASPQELMWRQQLADVMAQSAGAAIAANAAQQQGEATQQAAEAEQQQQGEDRQSGAREGEQPANSRADRLGRDVDESSAPLLFAGRKAGELRHLYQIKLHALKNDLEMEAGSMDEGVGGLLEYVSDIIGLIPFVKIVLYPILFFLKWQRIWAMAKIRYENKQRKIQRTIKLQTRALVRLFLQGAVSILAFIPIVNIIPFATIFKAWDAYVKREHKKN